MNDAATVQQAVLSLLALAGVAALYWCALPRFARKLFDAVGTWERVLLVALFALGTVTGADKGIAPTRAVGTLITALRKGGYIDPSGRVGSQSLIEVSRQMSEAAKEISSGSSNTIVEAQGIFDGLALNLTNNSYEAAYIAMDIPRAIANVHTNHNIAATFERVEQLGERVFGYVWYSQEPAIEPVIGMEYDIGAGYKTMHSVSNGYPETVMVNGVPCVVYEFDLPKEARGIPLRPEYELAMGGANGLTVPIGGVAVDDGDELHLPFTGWDVYSDILSVRYLGGIAVEANYMGTNYMGAVEL